MRHLRRPASTSYCSLEAPLRFILGLLVVVALLATISIALGGNPTDTRSVRSDELPRMPSAERALTGDAESAGAADAR